MNARRQAALQIACRWTGQTGHLERGDERGTRQRVLRVEELPGQGSSNAHLAADDDEDPATGDDLLPLAAAALSGQLPGAAAATRLVTRSHGTFGPSDDPVDTEQQRRDRGTCREPPRGAAQRSGDGCPPEPARRAAQGWSVHPVARFQLPDQLEVPLSGPGSHDGTGLVLGAFAQFPSGRGHGDGRGHKQRIRASQRDRGPAQLTKRPTRSTISDAKTGVGSVSEPPVRFGRAEPCCVRWETGEEPEADFAEFASAVTAGLVTRLASQVWWKRATPLQLENTDGDPLLLSRRQAS
jgi:hypothetical protein